MCPCAALMDNFGKTDGQVNMGDLSPWGAPIRSKNIIP